MRLPSFLSIFFSIFAKSNILISIFKSIKMLKLVKPLITLVTMFLSVIDYGFAYHSWYFAIGLVVMLFVHELGHVYANKYQGVELSAPIFIPYKKALKNKLITPELVRGYVLFNCICYYNN